MVTRSECAGATVGEKWGLAVKEQGWIALAAAVAVVDDFVVTNSITNSKQACLATNDEEACAYANAPGYTRLKAMCSETLDSVVFARVCPVGMIQGRDIETDQAFAARKRP